MTISEIALLFVYLHYLTVGFSVDFFSLPLLTIVFYLLLWMYPFSAQLDARSRYQNYKQIKDQIYNFGYNTRILKPVLKSRCQRDAAATAAHELGLRNECRKYFKNHGYRWYHLLPDFVFTHPFFFFSGYFWKTTFFAPTYKAKTDFKSLLSNTNKQKYFKARKSGAYSRISVS